MNPSSPVFALDTHGLLGYLLGEPRGAAVEQKLSLAARGRCRVLISAMSVGEMAYIVERRRGVDGVADALGLLQELPVQIVDVDLQTILRAARVKAQYPISFGDAFVVALAIERGATAITGDPEFRKIEHLIPICWLGV